MCEPASMWVTKSKVFWSEKSESHSEIADEFKLHVDGVRGANAVKIEISPIGGDFRLPLDQWIFKTDQDDTPKWYDAAEVEARVREVLPEWLQYKVVLVGQKIERNDRIVLANYGTVSDNSGTVSNNYGTVSYNYGTVSDNRSGGTVSNNYGTVSNNYGTVSNNSGTVSYNSGTVSYNSGTVSVVNSGQVVTYTPLYLSILKSSKAVLIDRSGSSVVCHVGTDQKS